MKKTALVIALALASSLSFAASVNAPIKTSNISMIEALNQKNHEFDALHGYRLSQTEVSHSKEQYNYNNELLLKAQKTERELFNKLISLFSY
jgi:hypothetical protein